MPARVIVTGIVLIAIISVMVFAIEFFLPLSAKSDMNILCRNTLLKMETAGGLTEQDRLELQASLQAKGFLNISVSGTQNARQGGDLNLHVEVEYSCSKLTALLNRKKELLSMVYDKSSLSRKVVN